MDIPIHFQHRIEKLRRATIEAGANLYLADHGELMGWLTGYQGTETMYRAVLIPVAGPIWAVVRKLDAPQVSSQGWLQNVIGFDDWADPIREVANSITVRNFGSAKILTDSASYSFTAHMLSRLSAELPDATFVFNPGLSDQIRAIKDTFEIRTIRQSSKIADQSMERLRSEIGVGMTSRDAGAIAASSYMKFGGDDGQVGRICLGQGGAGFLHAELDDTPLREGDVLHAELVPKVKRYSSRLMRPIAIGKALPNSESITMALIYHQDQQIAAMISGQVAADVDAVLRNGLLKDGVREVYENVSGYMLGLYGRTPRSSDFSHVFLPNSHWTLQSGMVFHMYTSAEGIGISETVLVTDQGGERLTQTPRQILISGPQT
ncbi:MAG: Xaa-Pro peptidase family protein [Planktomarina sp.]|nr:Xaa-Pro peptidase family protein [Planktomarina sp.]